MYWMGRDMGFHLAGMPMDNGMMAGMGLIVGGIGMAAWGLLPRNLAQHIAASSKFTISAPADAPLSWAHRSEEHTSELQSLRRNSYAVFCLKQKTHTKHPHARIIKHI